MPQPGGFSRHRTVRHNSVAKALAYPVVSFCHRGVTIMKSSIVKRSIVIAGHKTSVSLEDAFWVCVRGIAKD